jgi:outer membrane protein OmpA-like peptidoglycan-associated protein
MKKIITLLFVSLAMSFTVNSQEKTKRELKGDKFYFVYDFDKAIDKYSNTTLTEDGQRKFAQSLYNMNRNEEAEIEYAELVAISNGKKPEDYFNYAAVLSSNGKYQEAQNWMSKFQVLKPNDLRAKSFEKNKNKLNTMLGDSKKFTIVNLDFNTNDQDFGTAFFNDKIAFASSRAKPRMIKRTNNWSGLPFLNLYTSIIDGEQLSKPEKFDKQMKSKYHDGPASFAKKGTFMAFTQNMIKDKSDDKIVELQIHFSTLENGEWSEPVAFFYNNSEYSVGHPFLTEDGKTMYFTSNKPDGFGGADLYVSTYGDNNMWSMPINLGNKVNTEGDETFPFLDEKNQTLYFTSNGHYGLGGKDIFKSSVSNNSYGETENCGATLNTRYDDFALTVNGQTQKGYFSSNRPEGKGSDDIYSVKFLENLNTKKRIEGFAMNEKNEILPNVKASIFEESGYLIEEKMTNEFGFYSFNVLTDKNFTLTGTKSDYIQADNTASTFGNDTIVQVDLVLKQEVVEEDTIIEVNEDLAVKLKLNSIYFDYDMYNIRPDAATELDKIVKTMNKYPNMEVNLGAYTDCRGPEVYNQYLSDKRAESSINYIKSRITNPSRINGKGYGETKSLNDCRCEEDVISDCPKEQHQQNRRTEFIVVKK